MRRVAALALLALLAGCGDLPQPFLGRPGATAMRLAQPPPSRLAIPMPTNALLTDGAARAWCNALAAALVAQELPAITTPADKDGEWRLILSAELADGAVTPTYTVEDPHGKPMGATQGDAVPPQDWASGQAATMQHAAALAAPKVISLLTGIEARRELSDPKSLLNRPPVIFVKQVTGAPGDGDAALTRQMSVLLPGQGDAVQDTAKGSDYTVAGQVRTAQGANGTERIEIQWVVTDAQGNERGRVVQLNEVQPGSLDHYWGEVAIAVATEAAGGVHEVLNNASGSVARAAAVSDAKALKPGS